MKKIRLLLTALAMTAAAASTASAQELQTQSETQASAEIQTENLTEPLPSEPAQTAETAQEEAPEQDLAASQPEEAPEQDLAAPQPEAVQVQAPAPQEQTAQTAVTAAPAASVDTLTREEQNNIQLVTEAVMISTQSLEKVKAEVASLTRELKDSQTKYDQASKQYDDLKYTIRTEQENKATDKQKKTMADLEIQMLTLENHISILTTRLDHKQIQVTQLTEEVNQASYRSAALNQSILTQKKLYEDKAKLLATDNSVEQESLECIQLNEQRKKSIINLKEETETKRQEYRQQRQAVLDTDIAEINNKPYEEYQMDSYRTPLPMFAAERAQQINDLKNAFTADMTTFETSQNNVLFQYETQMKTEIAQTNAILAQRRTVSTLDRPDLVNFSSYDGKLTGWNADFTFTLGGQKIADYSIFLSYKKLTGKTPKLRSIDYKDTVETLDSFFRSDVPVVYAEIEYGVVPAESWKPSTYTVTIYSTTIYDLNTQKKIIYENNSLSGYYKVLPVNDIRSTQELKRDDKILSQMHSSESKKELKDAKNMQNKLAFSNKALGFLAPVKHCGFEAGVDYILSDSSGLLSYTAQASLPLYPFYLAADVSANGYKFNFNKGTTDKESGTYTGETIIDNSNATYDIGGLIGMHFSWFEQFLSPFIAIGGGVTIPQDLSQYYYFLQGQCGFHVLYAFNAVYNYRYCFQTRKASHSIGVRIGATGPWKMDK